MGRRHQRARESRRQGVSDDRERCWEEERRRGRGRRRGFRQEGDIICQRLSPLRCDLMERLGKGLSFLGACLLQRDGLAGSSQGEAGDRSGIAEAYNFFVRAQREGNMSEGGLQRNFAFPRGSAADGYARKIIFGVLSIADERVTEWKRLVMLSARLYGFAVTVLRVESSFQSRHYWARQLALQHRDLPAEVIAFLENPADEVALACAVVACHGHGASSSPVSGNTATGDILQTDGPPGFRGGDSRQAAAAVPPSWVSPSDDEATAVRTAEPRTRLGSSGRSADGAAAAAAATRTARGRWRSRRLPTSRSAAEERRTAAVEPQTAAEEPPTVRRESRQDMNASARFAYEEPMEGFSVQLDQDGTQRIRAYGFHGAPLTRTLSPVNFCVWAILVQLPRLEPRARTCMLQTFDVAGMKPAVNRAFALVLKHV